MPEEGPYIGAGCDRMLAPAAWKRAAVVQITKNAPVLATIDWLGVVTVLVSVVGARLVALVLLLLLPFGLMFLVLLLLRLCLRLLRLLSSILSSILSSTLVFSIVGVQPAVVVRALRVDIVLLIILVHVVLRGRSCRVTATKTSRTESHVLVFFLLLLFIVLLLLDQAPAGLRSGRETGGAARVTANR